MGHADEICFMVRSSVGRRVRASRLVLQRHSWFPTQVDHAAEPDRAGADGRWNLPGFFATVSGHVLTNREGPGADRWQWKDWFVDLGLSSRAEAEDLGIFPGCRVIWNPRCERFGESRITGKAMDDRAALAIATIAGEELAKRDDLTYEVVLASTVQEENGLIGAQSVADTIDVDLC